MKHSSIAFCLSLLLVALTRSFVSGFGIPLQRTVSVPTAALAATLSSSSSVVDDHHDEPTDVPTTKKVNPFMAASALLMANLPVSMVLAVTEIVEDDYEYGKVDAPIGLAVAGGLLAILTGTSLLY